jgi:trimeric autotransporter adhesin
MKTDLTIPFMKYIKCLLPITFVLYCSKSQSQFITTVAGGNIGDGLPAAGAGFNNPGALCKDRDGNIYIADITNNKIRRVDAATNIISTAAGNGYTGFSGDGVIASATSLFNPASVVTDRSGNLIVCDQGNHRIRKITASTGVITTIAGTGVAGFSGDNGPAVLAALSTPRWACLDTSGNIYIADGGNQRIRKIDAISGIITTVAGNGNTGFAGDGSNALLASFNLPFCVFADKQGNVFIDDRNNNRIRKVDAVTGIITTVAGTGVLGSTGDGGLAVNAALSSPTCIYMDNNGNLFIADFFTPKIRKVDQAGFITAVAGSGINGFAGDGGSALSAQFAPGMCIYIDSLNDMFIADGGNQRIRRVDAANNIVMTIAGTGVNPAADGNVATSAGLNNPIGVCFDRSNNMYITDRTHRVRKVDAATAIINTVAGNGTAGFSGDGGSAVNAQLNGPYFSCVDTAGNILIADYNNSRIRRINAATGIITTIAGNGNYADDGDGGAAVNASITAIGVCVDTYNNIYMVCNGRIRKINAANGIITTIAGNGTDGYSGDNGPATNALLNAPLAICTDRNNNLYFTEQGNHVVRKIDLQTGIITTVAGNGTSGFTGDGGPAVLARMRLPYGIGIDKLDNIYFVDGGNNRIRRIDGLTGVITTAAGTGIRGYSGDGGLAVNAMFRGNGLSADTSNNVYTADFVYKNVRKLSTPSVRRYTFTGNGSWDDAANWLNNSIPPLILDDNTEIVIDPAVNGECLLNRPQQIRTTNKLFVKSGKKFRIAGDLIIGN